MSDVYPKFDKATANLSATALIYNGRNAGRIIIKYGRSATAFVQIYEFDMTQSRATGYGYNKGDAAVRDAVSRIELGDLTKVSADARDAVSALVSAFTAAPDGKSYTAILEGAGFTLGNVI